MLPGSSARPRRRRCGDCACDRPGIAPDPADRLVPIRGGVEHPHDLAGADLVASDFSVPRRRAGEVDDRAGPAQDLLDRGLDQAGIGLDLGHLLRVLDQGEQAARRGIAGRLVPGGDQDLIEGEDVDQGKRLAVDRRIGEQRDQVVLRTGESLRAQPGEVGEQLDVRPLHRLRCGFAGLPELRIARAGTLVGPDVELAPSSRGTPSKKAMTAIGAEPPRSRRSRSRSTHGLEVISRDRDRLDLVMEGLAPCAASSVC